MNPIKTLFSATTVFFITSSVLSLTNYVYAQSEIIASDDLPADLTEIGLNKLLDFDLVVTSAGKKNQTISNVSSAIYVLSNEDIKRSGVTNIPEALRLVPGVNVARISTSQWAISVRGFNQVFANKLLVLVDGMSVFSPLTNGVYWENQDIVLEDVDRIEIIRGPGAALWGSNAVNGVINIITKKAKDTQGGLAELSVANQNTQIASVREGVKISDQTFVRTSAKVRDGGRNEYLDGRGAHDDWQSGVATLRLDTEIEKDENFTFYGNLFSVKNEWPISAPDLDPPYVDVNTFAGTRESDGGYGNATWKKKYSESSELQVQGNFSYHSLERVAEFRYYFSELSIEHHYRPSSTNDLVYGLSGRIFRSDTNGAFYQSTNPSQRTMDRQNAFLQDDITLYQDKLHLILGSKFEQNVSTGFEYMPNLRMIWTPNKSNSIWGAVSRAVAPPSLAFEDIVFPSVAIPQPNSTSALVTVFGDRGVRSEDLLAFELGYRSILTEKSSLDITTFYNQHDDILSLEPGVPYVGALKGLATPTLIIPLRFDNKLAGESKGMEISWEFKPQDDLRFVTGYSYLGLTVFQGNSLDTASVALNRGGAPSHQLYLRSSVDISKDISMDLIGRYNAKLSAGPVSDYGEADVRVAWRPDDALELSLTGQNLINDYHQEFVGNLLSPPAIQLGRLFLAKILWKF
jgi:iron complex outermembrane receptor protein